MKPGTIIEAAREAQSNRQYSRALARRAKIDHWRVRTLAKAFEFYWQTAPDERQGVSKADALATAPTLAALASEVQAIAKQCGRYVTRETPEEDRYTDLRLYLHNAGWRMNWGDPSYDQDHRGSCGIASIKASERATMRQAREAAAELLADAIGQWFEMTDIEGPEGDAKVWIDLVTQEKTR